MSLCLVLLLSTSLLLSLSPSPSSSAPPAGTKPFNILFVVSDDLRADIGGYYGEDNVLYTPNLNSFQQSAFTFTHAYTQQAVCAATRASFLTGTRPDTTRVWSNGPYFRDTMVNGSNVFTLPQYFKEHGAYHTVGAGKIFHPGKASGGHGQCNLGDDMPYSWSAPYWDCVGCTATAKVASPAESGCKGGVGCTQSPQCLECLQQWNCYVPNVTRVQLICPAQCDDDCFPDPDVAQQTLRYFAEYAQNESESQGPFFIAVGFRRPHSGQVSPLRVYDYNGYATNFSHIAIATHTQPPVHMPPLATSNCSVDVCGWADIAPYLYEREFVDPTADSASNFTVQLVNDSYHNHIRGAYYSSVSFMDEQFGKVIQGLYEYGLWENTVVVFTGDHGWHLGEQGCWAKYTNFEVATRVPLMIRIPGVGEGQKSDVLVEQLDMFPTMIDAAGIGFTPQIQQQLEGKSLLPFMEDPSLFVDYYAYSQFPRPQGQAPKVMGISMRTTQWRYTEWRGFDPGSNVSVPHVLWDVSHGVELYNHSNNTMDENDMNAYDNYNLAYDANMQETVARLHSELYQTWDKQVWGQN